jgi:transcription elongation factor Elf1
VSAALTFALTCPICASPLEHVASSIPTPRATTATMSCEPCGLSLRVAVKMSVVNSRRFDFDTLAAWIKARNITDNEHTGANADVSYMAKRLGIDRVTVYYYRRNGLSCTTADRLATHLNVHPAQVWPTWWDSTDMGTTRPQDVPAQISSGPQVIPTKVSGCCSSDPQAARETIL